MTRQLYPEVSHVINILDHSRPSLVSTTHLLCWANGQEVHCDRLVSHILS